MADYPLRQLAAEVQHILDQSVLFSGQSKSETEKATARENIGASPFGTGIKLISHFDSLADLEAAVPAPAAGDAYSVGTEIPYNLYAFDFYGGTWRNYGPIRANDISARFAQNVPVPINAWQQDTDVFDNYAYKAACPLAEVTGNDFPIVAFSPSDATGGNFCPIAYAFDGYVEIWAKDIPDADVSIPAITFIIEDAADSVTGNNTKGITNATGVAVIESEQIEEALGYSPGMVNPNLLDNWYFVGGGSQQGGSQFPINQRGQTSYSGRDVRIIDRWMLGNYQQTQVISSDGLEITSNTGIWFNQKLETSFVALVGKTITASALIDNELISITGVPDGTNAIRVPYVKNNVSIYVDFLISDTEKYFRVVTFTIDNTPPITIKAVKLELGSHQTLAHQENGVWVLTEVPNFGGQLVRCQQYYRPRYTALVPCYSNGALSPPPFGVEMRATPAISNITCYDLAGTYLNAYYYAESSPYIPGVFIADGSIQGNYYWISYEANADL